MYSVTVPFAGFKHPGFHALFIRSRNHQMYSLPDFAKTRESIGKIEKTLVQGKPAKKQEERLIFTDRDVFPD